jgi:hypothetical protein
MGCEPGPAIASYATVSNSTYIYIDTVVLLTISGAIASQDNRCSAMADGVEVR